MAYLLVSSIIKQNERCGVGGQRYPGDFLPSVLSWDCAGRTQHLSHTEEEQRRERAALATRGTCPPWGPGLTRLKPALENHT